MVIDLDTMTGTLMKERVDYNYLVEGLVEFSKWYGGENCEVKSKNPPHVIPRATVCEFFELFVKIVVKISP